MTRQTIQQRLQHAIGTLEGLAEDAATAADEQGLHPSVPDHIQTAVDALESALELT